jgi:hypothetical protein
MGTIAKPLLGFFLLLPVALLSAASCGGNAVDDTRAAGGSGVAAGAGGELNLGGAVTGGTSSGAASAAEGGASADGGAAEGAASADGGAADGGASAGDGGASPGGVVDKQACVSVADCTIVSNKCCCNFAGPVSDYAAINVAYAAEYQEQCNAADCPQCQPPFSVSDPIGPVANYVPTCRQTAVPDPSTGGETVRGQCVIVDLRATEITACAVAADCALRSGTQCCPGCGGSPISINKSKEPDLEALLCDATPVACSACAPTFSGYIVNCRAGRCGATFPE